MEELNYMLHKAINDNIDVTKDHKYLRSAATVWSSVCGLCLDAQGDLQTVDEHFSEIVNILLDMPFPTDDPMWIVCQPCLSNLKLFYGFREKCTTNHRAMQKLKQYAVDLPDIISEGGADELPPFIEFKVDDEIIAEEIEVETQSKDGDYEMDFELEAEPIEVPEQLLVIDKKTICPVCGHGVQGRKKLERHMKTHDPSYKGRRVMPLRQKPTFEITVLSSITEAQPETNEETVLDEKVDVQPLAPARGSGTRCSRKNSICTVCGHAVEGQKKLERHMRTHEPGFTRRKLPPVSDDVDAEGQPSVKRIQNNKYSCPVCGRMVESPNKLKRHMVGHLRDVKRDPAEVEASTCPKCLCEFPSVELMKIHLNDHEVVRPRMRTGSKKPKLVSEPSLCHICGKYRATRSSDMKIHIMRHRGEKPFKCEYCEKGFVSTNALRAHRRGHTGEKPYKCRYCPILYSDHTARKEHERRTHTFERPFPCTYCDKAFVCARVLKHHLITHTGEKNYECQTCGMLFNKAWNLKAHQNVHLREQGKEPIYVRHRKASRMRTMSRIKDERPSTEWESE